MKARLTAGFPGVRAALAYGYIRFGRDSDTAATMSALGAEAIDQRSRVNLALGLAMLGEHDEAFRLLERAQWEVPTLIDLRVNPLLAPLRADPRYARLLARSGFVP